MLVNGLSLAILTTGGFMLVYKKLPAKVRKFLHKHALFTDALACCLTYAMFGGTLVGLFAAAFVGIQVSAMLALAADEQCVSVFNNICDKINVGKKKLTAFIGSFAKKEQPRLQAVA